MRVEVTREDPASAECDALIVALPKVEQVPRALRDLDRALDGRISQYLESGAFEGKGGKIALYFGASGFKSETRSSARSG